MGKNKKLIPLQPWINDQKSFAAAMRALVQMGVPADYQRVRSWGAGHRPNEFARIVLKNNGFSS